MSSRKQVFAIFDNADKRQETLPFEKRILTYLDSHNATALVEPEDFNDADFVISMGGDGTFLRAAGRVGNRQIPLLGINMGRLGFLADVLPSEIESTLDRVLSGDYIIEDHTVIKLESDGEEVSCNPFALNDIAVLKRDNASMISIKARVNGDFLVNYRADGQHGLQFVERRSHHRAPKWQPLHYACGSPQSQYPSDCHQRHGSHRA